MKESESRSGGLLGARTVESSHQKREGGTTFLKLISNPTNARILSILRGGSHHTRQIAKLVGLGESHVSERLRKLENVGLVVAGRERVKISDKQINVRQYSLNFDSVSMVIEPEGFKIRLKGSPTGNNEFAFPTDSRELDLFVGRKRELENLRRKSSGLTVVWGLPGIGKTSLVEKYVAQGSKKKRRPVFWHELSEVDSLYTILSGLSIFLNRSCKMGELLELLESGIKDENALTQCAIEQLGKAHASPTMIFDDYHLCKDPTVASLFLAELCRKRTGARVILISRFEPSVVLPRGSPQYDELELAGLKQKEVDDIFKRLGVTDNELKEKLSRAARNLAGHPLSVKILCSSRLRDDEAATDPLEYIRSRVLETLTKEERHLLFSTCVFREPITVRAVEAMMRPFVGRWRSGIYSAVWQLESRGIVRRIGKGSISRVEKETFDFHGLIKEAAYESIGEKKRKSLHKQAARYYLTREPELESVQARHLLEALHHCMMGEDEDSAVRILQARKSFVNEGYFYPCLSLLDSVLQSTSETTSGKSARLRGWALATKAMMLVTVGTNLPEVMNMAEEVERFGQKMNDRKLITRSYLIRGWAETTSGRLDEAEISCLKGLEFAKSAHDLIGRAKLLDVVANVFAYRGRLEEAIRVLNEQVKILKKLGDTHGLLDSYNDIGLYHYFKGELEKAFQTLSKNKERILRSGYMNLLGYCVGGSGLVLEAMGRYEEALENFKQSMNAFRKCSNYSLLMYGLAKSSMLKIQLGDLRGARGDVRKALAMRRRDNRADSLSVLEMALGVLAAHDSKFEESEKHFVNGEKFFGSDKSRLGGLFHLRGELEMKKGNAKLALKYFERARDVFKELGAQRYVDRMDAEINRILPLAAASVV